MGQTGLKKRTAPWKKALPMLETVKRIEAWGKVLVMLKAVKVDPKKLKEMEKVLSRIRSDIEMSINRGEFSDLSPLYEQQGIAIRLQRTLEDLREVAEKLEQLEKKLQSVCKGG